MTDRGGATADPAPGSPGEVTVSVTDDQHDQVVDTDRLMGLAAAVAAGEGARGELHLALIGEEAMAGLNRQHMGHDGPTDVLAFPIDAPEIPGPGSGPDIPCLLGDVVVCPSVAARQAAAAGQAATDELELLVVHGVLHVLGWDHRTPPERSAMQARERHYLGRPSAGATAGTSEEGPR